MLCLFLPFLALKHVILHIFSIFFIFYFDICLDTWIGVGQNTVSRRDRRRMNVVWYGWLWPARLCLVKQFIKQKVSWMNVVWYGWLWPARLCLVKQFIKQKYHGIPLWTLHHTSKLVRYSFCLLNDQVISY